MTPTTLSSLIHSGATVMPTSPTNQRPTTPMAAPNDARTVAATKTLTINQVKRALFAAAERLHGPLKGRR